MDNVRTRKNSTYLYQDSDPVEGQFMWVKSERSNWQKNKIIKVLDKKNEYPSKKLIAIQYRI